MEDNGLKKEFIGQIQAIAEKNGVEKVILFGSRARSDYNKTSDIDLAVSGGNAAGFAADIEEETAQSGRRVRYCMKKYENFCAAFENLKEIYNYDEPYDTVVLTGLVGLYEICFEQSWKMMKEILTAHGYEASATGSPKTILKTAFKAGMIKDDNLWLEALEARNNVSHAYNREIANYIVKQVEDKFYNMFMDLKDQADKWML